MTFLFLNVLILIILLIIKIAIYFGLVKVLNRKNKFLRIVESFFIYEILVFTFSWIYYSDNMVGDVWWNVLRFISFVIVSFAIFSTITHLLKLFNWKKALICFLFMLIIAPCISYLINSYFAKQYLYTGRVDGIPIDNPLLSERIISQLNNSLSGATIMSDIISVSYRLNHR